MDASFKNKALAGLAVVAGGVCALTDHLTRNDLSDLTLPAIEGRPDLAESVEHALVAIDDVSVLTREPVIASGFLDRAYSHSLSHRFFSTQRALGGTFQRPLPDVDGHDSSTLGSLWSKQYGINSLKNFKTFDWPTK